MGNITADENKDTENLTCGGNCRFACSCNLLPCCKYQGNRKQLGIARRSRTDCTWELHQYILFEEVQREEGIVCKRIKQTVLRGGNLKQIRILWPNASGVST